MLIIHKIYTYVSVNRFCYFSMPSSPNIQYDTYSHVSYITCCNRSGNIWTTVTGLPDVRLTPYMGAVVLKVDLQSLEGVDSPLSHVADAVTGLVLSFKLSFIELVLLLFSFFAMESIFFVSEELEVAEFPSTLEAVMIKVRMIMVSNPNRRKF